MDILNVMDMKNNNQSYSKDTIKLERMQKKQKIMQEQESYANQF